jgi:hypothetical protein
MRQHSYKRNQTLEAREECTALVKRGELGLGLTHTDIITRAKLFKRNQVTNAKNVTLWQTQKIQNTKMKKRI